MFKSHLRRHRRPTDDTSGLSRAEFNQLRRFSEQEATAPGKAKKDSISSSPPASSQHRAKPTPPHQPTQRHRPPPRDTIFRTTGPLPTQTTSTGFSAGIIARIIRLSILAARALRLAPPVPPVQADPLHEAWSHVSIHTDGSFTPSEGRMGWGAVVSCRHAPLKNVLATMAGGAWGGNIALAEAEAVIIALESLPSCTRTVAIVSDRLCMLRTLRQAIATDSASAPCPGAGLDTELLSRLRLAAQGKKVTLQWIKAHHGNLLNEAADILADFGAGRPIPQHPRHHRDHPRAKAAMIAKLIEVAPA